MYKIVFVVAVFAFALQGALSSPVVENEAQGSMPVALNPEAPKNVAAVESNQDESKTTTSTVSASTDTSTTTPVPKSGASSTEMCLLLVQVSSIALVAKHMLF